MTSYSSRQIIAILEKDGWYRIKGSGSSHQQFKHPVKKGIVTEKHPCKDIPPDTLK